MEPRDRTQVLGLGNRGLCLQCYFDSPPLFNVICLILYTSLHSVSHSVPLQIVHLSQDNISNMKARSLCRRLCCQPRGWPLCLINTPFRVQNTYPQLQKTKGACGTDRTAVYLEETAGRSVRCILRDMRTVKELAQGMTLSRVDSKPSIKEAVGFLLSCVVSQEDDLAPRISECSFAVKAFTSSWLTLTPENNPS